MRVALLLLVLSSANAWAQSDEPQWQTAAGGKMAFEVASVKRDISGKFSPPSFALDNGDAFKHTGGRFTARFPVTVYITFAYKLSLTPDQIRTMVAKLPKWVTDDRFDIEARAAGDPTKDQMRLMMQSLLADRFHLKLHFETRDTPLLELTFVKPGKLGPKLKPHAQGPPCDVPLSDAYPEICDVQALQMNPNRMYMAGSRNTTIDLIAASLPILGRLERPVVDRTGLSGKFDFTLEWVPEPNGAARPDTAAPAPVDGPSFLDAVREQLGFKLAAARGPLRGAVIDSIESPSEN